VDRIVIIGHSGFIGARVAQRLAHMVPATPVVGFSAPETDVCNPAHAAHMASLITPRTTVLMLAGIKRQLGDSAEVFQQNTAICVAFASLMEATQPGRIVYLSSGAVYGEDVENLAITETSPLAARSYYGLSKIAAEFMLEKHAERHPECTVSLLRPATLYGPGDVATAYGPSGFLTAAVAGTPITLWGDGSELRELIYIDDAVDAIARCVWATDQRGPLNIVAGRSYTFKDALSAVERATGRPLSVVSKPRSKPKVDNRYDASRLKALFPDLAFTPLDVGVAQMLAIRHPDFA
jgi:UDP-glucose 4-epimerase